MTLQLQLAVFNPFTLRKGNHHVATFDSNGSKKAGNSGFFYLSCIISISFILKPPVFIIPVLLIM